MSIPITKEQNIYMWRTEIWEETKRLSKNYSFEPSEKLHFERDFQMKKRYPKTELSVENIDTIVVGGQMKDSGLNPLLLNFADDKNPGGCVDIGSGAQEESLFRRTNLCLSLHESFYPLSLYEAVYTPSATIFRDTETNNNAILEKPWQAAFIAAPGLCCPPLNESGRLKTKEILILKKKIKLIFQTGYKKGHDSLVLGALGCGAWRNPPEHVAELFKEVLEEYDGLFKKIVFACLHAGESGIITPDSSKMRSGPPSNYEIFKHVLDI
jgi:uncharacterized protein (TIGR02452 family)